MFKTSVVKVYTSSYKEFFPLPASNHTGYGLYLIYCSLLLLTLYVDSREGIKKLTKWHVGGSADVMARTAVNAVTVNGLSPDCHELMHVIATEAWGVPKSPWNWIHEGLATNAPGECAGAKIHNHAAALIKSEANIPFRNMMYNFREVDEITAYLEGASLIGDILEIYSTGAVRAIWQEGLDAIPSIPGRDIEQLEREWLAYVSQFPASLDALAIINDKGCL